MSNQLKCPRCGHLVQSSDWFCDYCGLPLARKRMTTNQADFSTNDPQQLEWFAMTPRRSHFKVTSKRNGTWRWLLLATIVVLGSGYSWGRYYYSKPVTLKRIIEHPTRLDAAVTDTGQRLSEKQRTAVKQMVRYPTNGRKLFQNHPVATAFTYRKTGSYWHLFDKYQIVVKTKAFFKNDKQSVNKPTSLLNKNEQTAQNLFDQLQRGMDGWTANGKVRQRVANLFVGGIKNSSYQYLKSVAQFYHANGNDVKYRFLVTQVHGNHPMAISFYLTYYFYSAEQVHQQSFKWHGTMFKQHHRLKIQFVTGEIKPFYDQVHDKK